MELIDREALENKLKERAAISCAVLFEGGIIESVHILNTMPTIDAEPVVRCKDCKNRYAADCNGRIEMWCDCVDGVVDECHYCAWGEQKER